VNPVDAWLVKPWMLGKTLVVKWPLLWKLAALGAHPKVLFGKAAATIFAFAKLLCEAPKIPEGKFLTKARAVPCQIIRIFMALALDNGVGAESERCYRASV